MLFIQLIDGLICLHIRVVIRASTGIGGLALIDDVEC